MSDLDQERETADKMIAMAEGDEDFDGEYEDEGGGGKRMLIMIGLPGHCFQVSPTRC